MCFHFNLALIRSISVTDQLERLHTWFIRSESDMALFSVYTLTRLSYHHYHQGPPARYSRYRSNAAVLISRFKSFLGNIYLPYCDLFQLKWLKTDKKYTMFTNVCGHPFIWVGSDISSTPVVDRCIQLSTQPCDLHRQTLAVEWPYRRAQWLSMWYRHRMPPFPQVILSIFCPARAALSNCKCGYCEVETSRRNNGSATNW